MHSIDPRAVLVNFTAIILSLTIHEFAHAIVAHKMGDPTPERYDRLNINPITLMKAHPFGALIIPLIGAMNGFLIGWAATPVNPRLVDRRFTMRQAEFWISIAGPLSNLILAALSAFAYVSLYKASQGSAESELTPLLHLSSAMVMTNIFLTLFNMIPVPPFDGFTVLESSAPRSLYPVISFIQERSSIVILFVFVFGGRILSPLIYQIHELLLQLAVAVIL